MKPGSGLRRATAICNAFSAKTASQVFDRDHPTTARESTSRRTARYSQPLAVGMEVMSVTHFIFGPVAVNSRGKTLGAMGGGASRVVVNTRRRFRLAEIAAFRMSRATRLQESFRPWSFSSRSIREEPYLP